MHTYLTAARVLALIVFVALTGCSGATETPLPPVDITGDWSGDGNDSSGPGSLSFQLVQTGQSVSGTFGATDTKTRLGFGGTVNGTVSGSAFSGTMTGSYLTCRVSATFRARVSRTTMTGTYVGTNSCTGPVTNGTFSLTRTTSAIGVVQVSPALAVMATGEVRQFTATASDAAGNVVSGRPISWSSSNPLVATVSPTGLVGAVAPGVATVSASTEGKTGIASLTVTQATIQPPSNLAATHAGSSSVRLGWIENSSDEEGFAVERALSANGPFQEIAITESPNSTSYTDVGLTGGAMYFYRVRAYIFGPSLRYSAYSNVASVIAGMYTVTIAGGGNGSGTVTTQAGLSPALTCAVTNGAAAATGCTATYLWGTTVSLSASPATGSTFTGWSFCAGTGSCAFAVDRELRITASFSGAAPVASVTVTLGSGTLSVGQTTQASAVVRDASGNILTGRSVFWASSNPAVATISSTGLINAAFPGVATIFASSELKTGSAVLTVTQPAGVFDGDWYSPYWRYAFRITGLRGTTLITNAPTYSVGDEMLRITRVQGNAFDGQQIFKDGQFHPVSGTLIQRDTLRMTTPDFVFGDNPWNMIRCAMPAGRLFAASVTVSFLGSGTPSDLYRVEASGCGKDVRIGRIRTASGIEPAIFDVALTSTGVLYGIDPDGGLYAIDTTTAVAIQTGSIAVPSGDLLNSLAADRTGRLYAATYPSGVVLALNSSSGAATTLGALGSGYGTWGDLVFSPAGEIFATVVTEAGGPGYLVRLNPVTFLAQRIGTGSLSATVLGLAFVGADLLGVTSDTFGNGELVKFDLSQGTATAIRGLDFNAGGAASRAGRLRGPVPR